MQPNTEPSLHLEAPTLPTASSEVSQTSLGNPTPGSSYRLSSTCPGSLQFTLFNELGAGNLSPLFRDFFNVVFIATDILVYSIRRLLRHDDSRFAMALLWGRATNLVVKWGCHRGLCILIRFGFSRRIYVWYLFISFN